MSYVKSNINRLLWVSAACAFTMGMMTTAAKSAEPNPTETVFDASFVEEVGGSERINFSGKLRMLSQRIPAAACNQRAGVDTFKSAEVLQAASAEFAKIMNALENGDASMGVLGAEKNRKALLALKNVHEAWDPMQVAVSDLTDASSADASAQHIADKNMELLGAAKLLVSQLSGQYSDPSALVQADAIRIDIAGRQRMLTQKISKEACHILSDINAEGAKAAISKTIQMFEVSLQALRFGMPEAGIKASDNAGINDGLSIVAANWQSVRPHLVAIEAGETLDLTARAELFNGLNTTMANMNKVVGLYSDASKLGL